MVLATKLDRVGIYNEEFPSIKVTWPFDLLYLYFHKASNHQTWQDGELLSETNTNFWTRGHVRSRNKFKRLHLPYHSAFIHQTCQGGYMQWRASFHKVIRAFDHVVKLNTLYITRL